MRAGLHDLKLRLGEMGLNLASILTKSTERAPQAAAIRLGARELSYAGLEDQSARLAQLLAERGLKPGDRVGVMLPNVPEFAICYYGALRAGAIVVPMNVLLKRREIAFYLQDSGAGILLAWHGFAEEAEAGAAATGTEAIEVEPAAMAAILERLEPRPGLTETAEQDTAVILYTSGTTGKPKGAELTHLNLARNAEISSETTVEVGEGDVVLGALPLFHSFGQTVSMNGSLRMGACLTMLPRFDPGEALATIERDRVTHFQGVPTMYGALLHHPDRERFDASTLRMLRDRRRLDAGRGPARLRAGLRRDRARGLWALGDFAGRLFNHPGRAQAGLDRHPDRGGRDAGRRRGGRRDVPGARSARS